MAIRDLLPTLASPGAFHAHTLQDFKTEMDKMFGALRPFTGSELSAQGFFPETEIHENDKTIVVSMELPGVEEKDVSISVTGDLLSVRGEKKQEQDVKEEDFYRSERSYGSFQRSMSLPFAIDEQGVEAIFAKGVLTLTIRKPDEVQAKTAKIAIKRAD